MVQMWLCDLEDIFVSQPMNSKNYSLLTTSNTFPTWKINIKGTLEEGKIDIEPA